MDKLIERLEKLGADFGPRALQNLRGVAVAEGFSALVWGAIFSAITAALTYTTLWALSLALVVKTQSYEINWMALLTGATGLSSIICAFVALANLADPWTYIAMTKPDLYITKKIVDRVTEGSAE